MTRSTDYIQFTEHTLRLTIRARPGMNRSRAPRIVDIGNDHHAIEITIAAPPEEGKANNAICQTIAKALKCKMNQVTIKSGHSGRIKIVEISPSDPALQSRIEAWIEAPSTLTCT